MGSQIAVGSRIHIRVLKTPRSAANRKTLVRLLMKDAALRRRHESNLRNRGKAIERRRRAGRYWAVIPKKAVPVKGVAGEEGTLLATADVVADLVKLTPYVEVTAGS